jgi:hypothetical protein
MTLLITHTHYPVYSSKGELAEGTAPSGSWSVVGRNAAGRLVVLANRYNEEDARELLGHRSLQTFSDQEVVANG